MTGLTGSGAWSVLSAADPAAAGQIPATPDQITRPAPDHKLPGRPMPKTTDKHGKQKKNVLVKLPFTVATK